MTLASKTSQLTAVETNELTDALKVLRSIAVKETLSTEEMKTGLVVSAYMAGAIAGAGNVPSSGPPRAAVPLGRPTGHPNIEELRSLITVLEELARVGPKGGPKEHMSFWAHVKQAVHDVLGWFGIHW
jgi:hypothetical protein